MYIEDSWTENNIVEMVRTAKTGVSLPNLDGENSISACKRTYSVVYGQHQVIFSWRRLRVFSVLPVYSDNALGFISRSLCSSSSYLELLGHSKRAPCAFFREEQIVVLLG